MEINPSKIPKRKKGGGGHTYKKMEHTVKRQQTLGSHVTETCPNVACLPINANGHNN